MDTYPRKALAESLVRLRATASLPAAVEYVRRHAKAINRDLNQTVIGEIPAFSETSNPEVLPDLARHAPAHTEEILRLLGGGDPSEFAFVRKHAERRAQQRFPLEATLHAYRCGHRVFSRWLRKAMLEAVTAPDDAQQGIAAVADFALEYTDTISTIAASAYVNQTRLLADLAGDRRAELLSILLEGYDESDRRVARILRGAGYLDQRQSFCVVLSQPVDPAEMRSTARARRLADAIDSALEGTLVRRLVDVRDNKVVTICSETRRVSGWTAPRAALAKRIAEGLVMVGNAALIGVSNDVPSTSQMPKACREAELALEIADVTNRVVQFSDVPARRLMLHLAGDEVQRVLPAWSGDFFAADDKASGALHDTLKAYANANMNVLRAADDLSIHPNTVYSRLQKLEDVTGLDAREYHALTELLIVADCRGRTSASC